MKNLIAILLIMSSLAGCAMYEAEIKSGDNIARCKTTGIFVNPCTPGN